MTPEQFYERSERIRKAKVAAREAAEKVENDALVQRLLREQEAAFQSSSEKVFVARDPNASGHWTHEEVIAHRTGKEVDPDGWLTARARNETLRRQTKRLAEALEREGISAYRNGPVTSLVGLVTGESVELTSYRSIRFLPLVAQRERREFVNQYIHLAETDHKVGAFARYLVFTNDQPIPVGGDLRGAMDVHFSEIVELGVMLKDEFGIEILLRATEMPIAERECEVPDEYGEIISQILRAAHLHSNLSVLPTRYLGPNGWAQVLRRIHEMFPGRQIQDCGKVEDARELIKYSVKPTDLENAEDAEIAWLYSETSRAHIVQPFNRFRALRASLKRRRLKVIANPEKSEEGVVQTVIPVVKEERKVVERDRSVQSDADEETVDYEGKECEEPEGKPKAYLLGTTTPQPLFSPFLEPCILIQNYGEDLDRDAMKRMRLLMTAARRVWDEAGAPSPEAALKLAAGLSAGIEGRIVSLRREAIKRAKKKTAARGGGNRIGLTHTGYRPGESDSERRYSDPPPDLRQTG